MDQDTRNKLQRATQQVRRILEEEFAEQLEGTFDVLPDGEILPAPGKHLDARQRLTRQKLVDAVEHIKAGGKTPEEAVDEYTREAAFTFLNRFVALRMLEARGLLQECVSKGDASSGFKEFCGLAPGLSSLDDSGYRHYLECLFDELTVEVKVLFDRRDSASLLWPRRGALTELLTILGQADLADVWIEDETIGWVYQYFNSGEERKKMREESSAPRNSRELAVRNQFFTPRYVVEFLTDNTLGRIWYEMRRGVTGLVDHCDHLVCPSGELFLDEGQEPPIDHIDSEPNPTAKGMPKATVYIPFRAKKDPRDLKILDPACGSGHFLLYAFDLLLTIYQEAWHDEESPDSEVTGRRLRDDYANLEELRSALPGLVLRHNLYGIDIDPRASQIAAFALWLRGQRAYAEFGLERDSRPRITKSNAICAEPMPGEEVLFERFIEEHLGDNSGRALLNQLVRRIFNEMKLAGEAGSLLKINEEIAETLREAKKQWERKPKEVQRALFDFEDHSPEQMDLGLDLSGISDEGFWAHAERLLFSALHEYAELAELADGYKRKLFADDATRGMALIDVTRFKYDVVLMNPPFGPGPASLRALLTTYHGRSKMDLYASFAAVGTERLRKGGKLGILSSRTGFFLPSLEDWRRSFLLGEWRLNAVADLGLGVLDEALVEAAAYVIGDSDVPCVFLSSLASEDKAAELGSQIEDKQWVLRDVKDFLSLPVCPIAYWITPRLASLYERYPSLEEKGGNVRVGLQTSNDFRFVRLIWEVASEDVGNAWVPFAKGGEYSLFYDDVHLVVYWRDRAKEMKAFALRHGDKVGAVSGLAAR